MRWIFFYSIKGGFYLIGFRLNATPEIAEGIVGMMLITGFKYKIRVRNEGGTVLAAVAVVAFFIALAALASLALSLSQLESIDDETDRLHANVVAEAGMEEALYSLRSNNPNYTPVEIEGLSEMTPQELLNLLRDPEHTTGTPYDDDPEQTYYVAMDRADVNTSADPDFETISGDSSQFIIKYVDDSTVVRSMSEWDYQERLDEENNWLFSVGETRRTQSEARAAVSGKAFEESRTRLQRREVQVQNFNENHPEPPYIESEHDSYDINQTRNWVVSYPSDPNNPNRKITGIELIIDGNELGLGSASDTLSFSAWNGSSFDPPFFALTGPVTEGGSDFQTASPIKTNTLKVTMKSDSIDDSTYSNANYGFRVSGILYHYTSDMIAASFETPHPYDTLDSNSSFIVKGDFFQVIYAPYALPQDRVNPIKPSGDEIINPRNPEEDGGGVGNNSFQVMRIHFDELFSLEAGDSLEVYNANSGVKMVSYTGSSGANAYTPWAFRTNSDFPLAIALDFSRDGNNDSSTNNYGYKVDRIEYTNENGDFIVVDDPIQMTAHGGNIGYNDGLGGAMRYTTIFKPADPPLGGTVTNWKVIFDIGADLVDNAGDMDRITLRPSAILEPVIPDQYYVSPTGFYGALIGGLGYHDIAELKNLQVDMTTRDWLEIVTEFDNNSSFVSLQNNFGWSIARVEVDYSNAMGVDKSPPRLRSSAITIRGVGESLSNVEYVVYPSYGRTADSIGEWWVASKNHKQILLHFDLESFRVEEGDHIEIYDDMGNLIERLYPEGEGEGGIHGGPINGGGDGGGPIETEFTPNPPAELVERFGWVIVRSEAARIVLVGDGSSNVGYSGFDIDRVAFWSPTVKLRNFLGDYSTDETGDYSKTEYEPVKKYVQY